MSAVLTQKRHHVPLSFLIGVLLVLVLIVVLAVVLSSIAFPGTTSRPSADRYYDVIEQARVQRANVYAIGALGYDHIESIRIQRSIIPFLTSDGYAAIEEVRGKRALDGNVDRSYDSIEALRLGR